MTTTEYLQREIRRVELSIRRAERKPNVPHEELRGLHEKLEHLQEAMKAVEELARVTAERDAAAKDRAELADYELAVCEQFCLGDREHDIAPCAWLIDGMCKLREWRGPQKEE